MNQSHFGVHRISKEENMKKLSLIYLLAIVLAFPMNAQREAKKDHQREVEILPYKVITNDAFFKVMSYGTPEGSMDRIQGFEYEWGYTYELLIDVKFHKEVIPDGSDREYILKKVISKTPVEEGLTFKLYLNSNIYLGEPEPGVSAFEEIEEGLYLYYYELEMRIPKDLMPAFQKVLDGRAEGKSTFKIIGPNRVELVSMDF